MKSELINELATALSKAQAEMNNPFFDSINPHFRNKYASLASVRNAVIPHLAKHGLALIQHLTCTDKSVQCSTILLHSSGQWWELEPFQLPVAKFDAQGFGSAATYARRYTLLAVAGVVGEEDDDANAAARTKPTASKKNAAPEAKITPDQYDALKSACSRANITTDHAPLLSWLGVGSLNSLPASKFAMAIEGLAKKEEEVKRQLQEADAGNPG